MFSNLSQRFTQILDKLRGGGVLKEEDISLAMREIRIALLEADVALPVVRDFIEKVKVKALGKEVLQSITPGQMVVKIVHDALVEVLGGEEQPPSAKDSLLNFAAQPPVSMVVAGLQGAGKTTTVAKLASFVRGRYKKKILMVSLDVYRPAAQEQLETLGKQLSIATLPIIKEEKPLEIVARALETARLSGVDLILFDTAGRLHVDEPLMTELKEVCARVRPTEIFLVADSMTGQDAVTVAQAFKEAVSLTGVILTRTEGDGRGGAALSMRVMTGCPIKFLGTGEQLDKLELFQPERMAGRILDMGDVVGLVEKMAATISQEEAQKTAERFQKGHFDLNDLESQLLQIKKMGGMTSLLSFLPGFDKIQDKLGQSGFSDKQIHRQIALIRSMTAQEKRDFKILNASRKKRIVAGSGTTIQELNRLLKQFQDMATMMKRFQKGGEKGLLRQGLGSLFRR